MDIKIDETGHLYLKRGQVWKPQYCPHQPQGHPCGDWCSVFGEPDQSWFLGEEAHPGWSALTLCEVRTLIGNITDERTKA